jgi:hypothetical protein
MPAAGVEIACMNGHSFLCFGRQFGRRADEHRDHIASCDRLTEHMATEGPRRAQDQRWHMAVRSATARPQVDVPVSSRLRGSPAHVRRILLTATGLVA